MEFNYLAIFVAAIVPIVLGFIWYNPKVFGTAWAREAEMTEEKMKSGNMPVIFLVSLVLSFILAFFLQALTNHQMGAFSLMGGDPTLAKPSYEAFMADYGNVFRTFKHGALHGAIAGIFMYLPVIAINGMFERKSWKYILINGMYWTISLTIMGAIVCGWL
ncbi:DUF1761 domain-containing protein [Psychroserpens jangbogonensis]|uniref:DUF1761 domain-containing protein n=1 Tax=Psychroserpens jangbogonensis TaxID=1484460 RepID=UPI00053DFB1C|nr:DUF1761 domain-containing protein [Psychroserpens jangbogonensis]